MSKLLIVIDVQNDFVNGSLGSNEAQAAIPAIKAKIKAYSDAGHKIIFTRDTHGEDYLQTPEGIALPVVHCIKDTHGWQIYDNIDADVNVADYVDKPNFGWQYWDDTFVNNGDFTEVEIIGLTTDICVISNALILKALNPDVSITVDSACCAATTPQAHEAALTVMRSCQINVI